MIQVTIARKPDRSIAGFAMSGHAGYAEFGNDIVCAGVSAVAFGTINAIEALVGVQLVAEASERGNLHVQVPNITNADEHHDVQLLLEAMAHTIKDIAATYNDHVEWNETIR